MDRINVTRVVLGGLVAGLVINISEFVLNGVVLASSMEAAMARLNLPPVGTSAIAIFMVLGFALGIAMIWLYAAIRPRFGPGITTAMYAGLIVWFLAYLYPSIGMQVIGVFPSNLTIIGVVWGAAELVLASLVGASLYQESPEGRAVRA